MFSFVNFEQVNVSWESTTTKNGYTLLSKVFNFCWEITNDFVSITSLNTKNKSLDIKTIASIILTHFWAMFPFYTPCKQQKTFGFLVFLGGIKRENWLEVNWYKFDFTIFISKSCTKFIKKYKNISH